ncbi:hypothetical protein JKP88DRAFT_143180, partial [Tribonema minus]
SNYDEVHELVLSRLSGPQYHRGLLGLTNMGNTCFMNTALQCLSNCVPLTDYFLAYDFRKEINASNRRGHGGAVAEAYGQLVNTLWGLGGEDGGSAGGEGGAPAVAAVTTLTPSDFKAAIDRVIPHFQGFQQHDVHEYLAFLLDAIHEDLNRVVVTSAAVDGAAAAAAARTREEAAAREAWRGYLLRNKSIVVDLFQGQLRSALTCDECGHVSVTFDPFMYLSVPV